MVSRVNARPAPGPDDPIRTLIADDDPACRDPLGVYLARTGRFEVVECVADGVAAIEAAAHHQPDVTILDLRMPRLDGLAALPRIREAAPNGAVIVLTGLGHPKDQQRALASGAMAYLHKHVRWSALAEQILGILDAASVGGGEACVEGPEHLHLPCDPMSSRLARDLLRRVLPVWGCSALLDDAQLLTSELVTNAVEHARSEVDLTITLLPGCLRVEVVDTGPGALRTREADPDDVDGRGLAIVEALASNWGTAALHGSKRVWFELITSSVVDGEAPSDPVTAARQHA